MLREFKRLLKVAAVGWWNDRAMSLGAAIAFFTVFSLAPILLTAIAVAGLAFGREAAQGAVVGELGGLIGESDAKAVEAMIASASNVGSGVIGTTVGILTFLLLATGAIVELQDDLNIIWKVQPPPSYGVMDFVRTRLLSLALVSGIGFLLLVSLVVDAALTSFGAYLGASFSGAAAILWILNSLVSFAARDVSVRHDLQGLAGRRPDLEGCRDRRDAHGGPVHPRQVRDRILSRAEQRRLELRRRRIHHHDPPVDLLLLPHSSLRGRIHQGFRGESRQPDRQEGRGVARQGGVPAPPRPIADRR